MVTFPTVPKQILNKLSSGVVVEDCGMPTPIAGQTIICKAVAANTVYQTIHTVTAGKTFYLMGILAASVKSSSNTWYLSFDGGTTDHLSIRSRDYYADMVDFFQISPNFPIAQASSESVIQAKNKATNTEFFITIWGWEE